jgi:hypothetical protein
MPDIADALRNAVRMRAKGRCEYCLIPEGISLAFHQIDHIIATKHGGTTSLDNLALCRTLCNRYKGSDLASIDSETGELMRLFHPRRDPWKEHFEVVGCEIRGRTPVGKVTVRLLRLNRPERIVERETLVQAGFQLEIL